MTPSASPSAPSINSGNNFGQPSASFRPTQVQNQAPQTHQNLLGISPFLGGTINNVERGASELGSEAVDLGAHALSPFMRALSPVADLLGGLNLSDLITNRFGLGGWFNPRQAS